MSLVGLPAAVYIDGQRVVGVISKVAAGEAVLETNIGPINTNVAFLSYGGFDKDAQFLRKLVDRIRRRKQPEEQPKQNFEKNEKGTFETQEEEPAKAPAEPAPQPKKPPAKPAEPEEDEAAAQAEADQITNAHQSRIDDGLIGADDGGGLKKAIHSISSGKPVPVEELQNAVTAWSKATFDKTRKQVETGIASQTRNSKNKKIEISSVELRNSYNNVINNYEQSFLRVVARLLEKYGKYVKQNNIVRCQMIATELYGKIALLNTRRMQLGKIHNLFTLSTPKAWLNEVSQQIIRGEVEPEVEAAFKLLQKDPTNQRAQEVINQSFQNGKLSGVEIPQEVMGGDRTRVDLAVMLTKAMQRASTTPEQTKQQKADKLSVDQWHAQVGFPMFEQAVKEYFESKMIPANSRTPIGRGDYDKVVQGNERRLLKEHKKHNDTCGGPNACRLRGIEFKSEMTSAIRDYVFKKQRKALQNATPAPPQDPQPPKAPPQPKPTGTGGAQPAGPDGAPKTAPTENAGSGASQPADAGNVASEALTKQEMFNYVANNPPYNTDAFWEQRGIPDAASGLAEMRKLIRSEDVKFRRGPDGTPILSMAPDYIKSVPKKGAVAVAEKFLSKRKAATTPWYRKR